MVLFSLQGIFACFTYPLLTLDTYVSFDPYSSEHFDNLRNQYLTRVMYVIYLGPICAFRLRHQHAGRICEAKTLPTYEMRWRARNYCRWNRLLKVWTVNACTSLTPQIPLAFTFDLSLTHRFAATTLCLCQCTVLNEKDNH